MKPARPMDLPNAEILAALVFVLFVGIVAAGVAFGFWWGNR